ncbi:adenosine deaminase 2-like [Sitophilus oryzae]|uniref:Adenosine deaminase n=1 Tax=Sitophilus oryzae TaxID=7048 RepID=A0A6J2YHK4_SITOR|nr:adenosine deaminase 2-like [Sitophilus oryzae]
MPETTSGDIGGERNNLNYLPFRIFNLFILIVAMGRIAGADTYVDERSRLINEEKRIFMVNGGGNLSEKEEVVNRLLLRWKKDELDESYKNSSRLAASENFLVAKDDIEQSKVFQLIRKLPKGSSLHTHFLAGVNIDWIISNITYNDNIYACYLNNIFKLRVLQDPKQDANCSWKSLKTYRKEFADENKSFDEFLKDKMTLGIDSLNQSREEIWSKFKNTFSTLYDLVAYRPIFKRYIYRLLEELYEDNVFYTELRGTFMPLYEINGTTYDTKQFLETFIETVAEFKESHPKFVGAKYIHCLYRGVDNTTLKAGLEQLIYFKSLFPDFIAGFDFVGLEEDGKELVDFHDELLGVSQDVKFFFHAGETFQYGHTDLNLVDAILLNSSRIGHAFSLAKHPVLLNIAREKDIPVELSLISNQVLRLNDDPRNHPATVLLSQGYPVVICNDDPSVWSATGLSYDWYVVFMTMTWKEHGLEILKIFARNSIQYSAMSDSEKTEAFSIWNEAWNEFVDLMIENLNKH